MNNVIGVAAIVVDVGVGAAVAAQVFLFMSTFNALLTSISFDDQATAGVDAGVGAAAGVANAGVGSDDDWWSTTDDGALTEDSDGKWSTDDDWSYVDDEGDCTNDEEAGLMMHAARCQQKRRRIATIVLLPGMYHYDKYMNKATYRVPLESGYQWTMRTLGNRTQCYNMFRMHNDVFIAFTLC